jgi:hypothetical protein
VQQRARPGDEVHLMVHEPFLAFDPRKLRQNIGAVVHRLMLRILVGSARCVWVSTPSFIDDVRRFAPRGNADARWLPIPSPVSPVHDPAAVETLRQRLSDRAPLVGHFGTCNPVVAPILESTIEQLCTTRPDLRFAILGLGTQQFVNALIQRGRIRPSSIVASGERSEPDLSLLLQCCDVFVQPYADGLSSRRTTLMALLAHGCAVVSSAGVRTEADWPEWDAVRLTPEGDAAAAALAALNLIDVPALRKSLGERARATYEAHFDISRVMDVLVEGAPA